MTKAPATKAAPSDREGASSHDDQVASFFSSCFGHLFSRPDQPAVWKAADIDFQQPAYRGVNAPQSILDTVDLEEWYRGRFWFRLLLNQPGPGGWSVLNGRYFPHQIVPRHWHDVEQVIIVQRGELRQGNRVFGPGDGYFTPAHQSYTITAGSEGAEFIEFRSCPIDAFAFEYDDENPSHWTSPATQAQGQV